MNELTTTDNRTSPFFTHEFLEAVNYAAEAIKEVGRICLEAMCRASYVCGYVARDLMALLARCVCPKWVHLARYARKKRTRQKYQRMIARCVAEIGKGVKA